MHLNFLFISGDVELISLTSQFIHNGTVTLNSPNICVLLIQFQNCACETQFICQHISFRCDILKATMTNNI